MKPKKGIARKLLAVLFTFVLFCGILPKSVIADELGKIAGLSLDQTTGFITWDAYSDATHYAVWVDPVSGSGQPLSFYVTETSFDLRQGLGESNVADGTYYPYVLAYKGSDKIASTGQRTTEGYAWSDIRTELSVPGNVQWDGTTASWSAVSNATKYEYGIFPADGSGGAIITGETTNTSATAKASSYIAGKAYVFKVRAVGDGSSYTTGKYGSSATVTKNAHPVRINPITNGTVIADKAEAVEGDPVKLTVTASVGYELESIKVTYGLGAEVALNPDYSFTMPDEEVIVNATFKAKTYSVSIESSIGHGKITADKTSGLQAGELVTLIIAADTGYVLDFPTVKDDATNVVTMDTTTTFKMPAANVNVDAAFKSVTTTTTYELKTTVKGGNGTVSAGKTDCASGSTQTITFFPDANYEIDKVTVNGVDTGVLSMSWMS